MGLNTENNKYINYLKDEKFIEWKLLPNDELNNFWSDFVKSHPEEKENLELADQHFHKIKLSYFEIPEEKRVELRRRLKSSVESFNRKRRLRNLGYVAAACISILIISLIYFQRGFNQSADEAVFSPGYIVGSELESQDIILSSGNNVTSFQENIDIHIQNGNNARVITGESGEKEVKIADNTMNRLIVPYGKRSKIILSDGTKVWLNSGSILEFPSMFEGSNRTVTISGEMYIEVAEDSKHPFVVIAPEFNVQVLGTKFNVTAYEGSSSSVVLVEGSVELKSSAAKEEIILAPNQQALLSDSGTFNRRDVDAGLYTSWKDGYLTFSDTPIMEALKQIERYYNLSFNFGDNVSFAGSECTGKIILSDNLDNVLTALSLISSTNYKRENNSIFIYKN